MGLVQIGGEIRAKPLNDNFQYLDGKLLAHKAETTAQFILAQRDATIVGIQTISILDKMPKKVEVIAVVQNTNKFSICNNHKGGALYQISDSSIMRYASENIAIADTVTNRTFGVIKNIKKGSFDIEWTHTGTGATGTIYLVISVLYHGD